MFHKSKYMALISDNADLAQLAEHLSCKQGVGGSNPVFRLVVIPYYYSKDAGVAELADAQDLKSCG